MTLDEAIIKLLDDGVYDPANIAQEIERRYDKKWLANELLTHSPEIIAIRTRNLYRAWRKARHSGKQHDHERQRVIDLYGAQVWIPGEGYKTERECTAPDLIAAAAYLHAQADGHRARAHELEALARMVEDAGVETVAELPARASERSESMARTPARAITSSISVDSTPARAKAAAK